MLVQKAYRYRFFPTDSQKMQLANTFGGARFVWNQGLELRSKTYQETPRSLSYAQTTEALPRTNAEAGIHMGIKMPATSSNGKNLENPRPLRKAAKRPRLGQRRLSRKVKGSKNRNKQRIRVAKQHARIRDIRADTIHQFTTATIRENQAVYVEGLNVAGLLKNHKLAKRLNGASSGEIFRQHEYRARWYGRECARLDQYFPSTKRILQFCSVCRHLLVKLPLSVREWTCAECDTKHERDGNALKIILLAGRYLRATGSDARKVNACERRTVVGRSA